MTIYRSQTKGNVPGFTFDTATQTITDCRGKTASLPNNIAADLAFTLDSLERYETMAQAQWAMHTVLLALYNMWED